MAGYWTYRQIFGQDVRSLDGLAADGRLADVRLDAVDTRTASAEAPLKIGLR
jgi:hypothetical protein